MKIQSHTLPKPAGEPIEMPCPQEVTADPFAIVVDTNHGSYCREVENEVRERIHREEEQERLQAFMRAANAD